jgi:hypothetical protein
MKRRGGRVGEGSTISEKYSSYLPFQPNIASPIITRRP